MLIVGILAIVAGYYLFKNHNSIDFGKKNEADAQEILKKKYVNGEINEETYLKMKQVIR